MGFEIFIRSSFALCLNENVCWLSGAHLGAKSSRVVEYSNMT